MQTDLLYPLWGTLKDNGTVENIKRGGGNLFLIFLTFVNLLPREGNSAGQRLQGINVTNTISFLLLHYIWPSFKN